MWPKPLSASFGAKESVAALDPNFNAVFLIQSSSLVEGAVIRFKNDVFASRSFFVLKNENLISKIEFAIDEADKIPALGDDESYVLEVFHNLISIKSKTSVGALHALTTLSQLVVNQNLAQNNFIIEQVPIVIKDKPRFIHRGILLDTARNFIPVADILRTIDGLAFVKMNVLHWHIVDSQSFPFVSETYPLLSGLGAYSAQEIYTAEDISKIVSYAAERGVRVVPEFDMPAHSYAWGLAFPEIMQCTGDSYQNMTYCVEPPCGQFDPFNEKTYKVIGAVIQDAAKLFPDNYFHIGGDEVNSNCWGNDTQAKLEKFEERIWGIVKEQGKQKICWNELIGQFNLKPDPDSTLVQVWLSKDKQNILNQGYRIIDSNYEYWYLDCGAGNWLTGNTSWCDPFKAWQDMYLYDPAEGLNDAEARLVIGGEAAMWGEQLDVNTLDQKIWPRLSTVAERLWGLPEEETMKIKDKRVRTQAALYRLRYHYLFLLKKGIKASGLQPKFCHVSPYCDDYTL